MNVYDFDETIYNGDSTFDFVKYCIKNQPSLIRKFGKAGVTFCSYRLKKRSKTDFKEKMYSFLQGITNIDEMVERFWDEHIENIKGWYIEQKKPDDVIISASPRFLLDPVCNRLGIVNLLASNVDKHTGFYYGINCFGAEKVAQFKKNFIGEIDNFYSDSLSDTPLAKLADKAFIVQGNTLIPWKF